MVTLGTPVDTLNTSALRDALTEGMAGASGSAANENAQVVIESVSLTLSA